MFPANESTMYILSLFQNNDMDMKMKDGAKTTNCHHKMTILF